MGMGVQATGGGDVVQERAIAPPPSAPRSTTQQQRKLKVLLHDFAGHPFQVDLSRALASRGHEVLHVYCKTYTSGKGRFDDDVPNLSVVGLAVGEEFARYSPVRRVRQEISYGRQFTKVASDFQPDIVLACNVPLVALRVMARWFESNDVPWVFWLQDLYSRAVAATAEERAGVAGKALSSAFELLERSLLRKASHVVTITEDFTDPLDSWGIAAEHRTVIENWAPLADLPVQQRDNDWQRAQGLGDRFTYLYTGTLGLKHRPELLYRLAEQRADDADVVVISEGRGEARLRELQDEKHLPNLKLLGFQPFDRYPEVIGAADVLVALLEPSAGQFSVPSKVLSYLCAGRPVLGAIPQQNLAARTIEKAGAGIVVPPTDEEAFLLAAKRLRTEESLREQAGRQARAYAEAAFNTEVIADRFLDVICNSLGEHRVLR